MEETRIDKWLWAVRIFKTRSIATAECLKGRVLVNGIEVKPSRIVRTGDLLVVKKPPILCTFRVKGIVSNRISAKLVENYLENLTSEEELKKLDMVHLSGFINRDRGEGRPTKKDRRNIDRFLDRD
jgi:ribosome-associated heat shock protein Hsp15